MSMNLFYDYLDNELLNIPVNETDFLEDEFPEQIDINHNHPKMIDGEELIHFYYHPNDANGKIIALENHNTRVNDWNEKHPNYEIWELDIHDDLIHPIRIGHNIILSTRIVELIGSIGIIKTTMVINKTALVYFSEKLSLAQKLLPDEAQSKYNRKKVDDLKKWFVNYATNSDEIETLFEKDYSFELVMNYI